MTTPKAPYFSSDYQQARQLFIEGVQHAGAQLESYECPRSGPDGDRLYMDVASIGNPEADTLFVITSAVHGVEGFAGSSVQCGLLSEGIVEKLGDSVHMVMIHGVNPYGFAHLRRFNEDNVDVNRNFVAHPFKYPGNKNHAQLADVLAPKRLTRFSNIQLFSRLVSFWMRHDFTSLAQAIVGGQSILPRGLYYGGETETWSNLRVQSIISRYAASAKKVVVVDLHTGLGGFGEAVILVSDDCSGAQKRAATWWKNFNLNDKRYTKGKLNGTLREIVGKLVPAKEYTVATVEFGTMKWWQKIIKPLIAIRNENWVHHFGTHGTSEAKEIKEKFLHIFSPNNEQWKTRVWHQGRDIVCNALAGLQEK